MDMNYFASSSASLVGPENNTVPFILPAPANGSTRRRLPDNGVAILREFAEIHRREPISQEARELVARIQQEVSYEITYRSVKDWFYRRRTGLSSEVALDPPCAAKTSKGGSRRLIAQEGVDILRGFALDHGRYPSSDEVRSLIERIRERTGDQTQATTVKRWFIDHRSQYHLQTLIDARKASLLTGGSSHNGRQILTEPTPLTIRVPPRRSVPTGLPAASARDTATHPNPAALPMAISVAPSLSHTHLDVLKSLQALEDDGVRDVVVSVCAAAWGVDKGMVEDWLRENRPETVYAPPTPISPHPFSPVLSSNGQKYPFPPSTQTEDNRDMATDKAGATLFGQFTHGWPPETKQIGAKDQGMSVPAPANVTISLMAERAIDPLSMAKALVEAIRESEATPPSGRKPRDAIEFKALWTTSGRLGNALDIIQLSPSC